MIFKQFFWKILYFLKLLLLEMAVDRLSVINRKYGNLGYRKKNRLALFIQIKESLIVKIFIWILFFSINSFLYGFNYFSPIIKSEYIHFSEFDQEFNLKFKNIIINSEVVQKDSISFIRGKNYTINYEKGIFIYKDFPENLDSVEIEYLIYPEKLLTRFSYYEEQEYNNERELKSLKQRNQSIWEFQNNPKLNIAGSKSVAVSFSNNEEIGVDQSLFLKLDGEISPNVFIEAQLNDSQSPITPEGNSRELSSLDQIYLKLYGNQYEVAFGDLDFEINDTKLINYNPLYEGLRVSWFGKNEYKAAMAISKGKNSSYEFSGEDGKQGPYYLYLGNNLESIQIIAGSESIFLNGVILQRGNDYSIDYSEGSITFKNKYFVGTNSKIRAEFQYTDEFYRNNMYLSANKIKLTDKISIASNLIFRKDDKENPLQNDFSEADIDILKSSGDNSIWSDGVTETEIGSGNYVKIDSDEEIYYEYVGFDSTGNYLLHFEYVGAGRGSYSHNDSDPYGKFIYSGEFLGDWLPQEELKAPEEIANYDVNLIYLSDNFYLKTEGLFSEYDKNTFSSKNDNDNSAYSTFSEFKYYPDFDKIKLELKINAYSKSENLITFSDFKDDFTDFRIADFAENDSLQSLQLFGQFKLNFKNYIIPEIKIFNKEINNFSNFKGISYNTVFKQKYYLPQLKLMYQKWEQSYEEFFIEQAKFDDYFLSFEYRLYKFLLKGNYQNTIFEEEFQNIQIDTQMDKLGKKNVKRKISWETENWSNKYVRFFYNQETEFNKLKSWEKISLTDTYGSEMFSTGKNHTYKILYSQLKTFNSDVEVTDTKFDMAELIFRNEFLKDGLVSNAHYELKNLEFYPRLRELFYVGESVGNYWKQKPIIKYLKIQILIKKRKFIL